MKMKRYWKKQRRLKNKHFDLRQKGAKEHLTDVITKALDNKDNVPVSVKPVKA